MEWNLFYYLFVYFIVLLFLFLFFLLFSTHSKVSMQKKNKCNKVNMQCIIPVRGPPPSLLEDISLRLLDEDSEASIFFILSLFYT
jgi:hypothetical protein